MDSQKVLLRKGPDSRYSEVGTVLAQRGKFLTVLLPDGTTIDHERDRDELTPVAGSFVHLARIAPDVVIDTLEQSPAVVYKQLLLESRKKLTARELKQQLSAIDRALVDRSWKVAKPALDDDPDVQATDDRPPAYTLDTDTWAEFVALFPARSDPATPNAEPQEQGQPDAALTTPPSEDTAHGADVDNSADLVTSEEPTPDVPALDPPTATPPDDRPLLVQRLTPRVDGLDGAVTLADLTANLLVLGEHTRKLSASAQADLVEGLTSPERRLLALAAGAGKNDLLSQEVADLALSDYVTAVDNAITEVARRSTDAKSLKGQLAGLLGRALAAGDPEPELLIRLARAFSDSPLEPQGLHRVLELVGKHLRSDESRSDLRRLDLAGLARAARGAPFVRTGGRSSLVAALYRRDPHEARQGRWWDGARLAELAEAGHGPLATALEDQQVARDVVAPLVADHLSQVSSRSGMAWLWSLPAVLGRHVTGDGLARVLAELAGRDQVVAQWRDGMTNADHIAAMDNKISSLTSALDVARADVEAHRQRIDKLQADLLHTADQLAHARTGAAADRTAHDRQIKLDLMRTLALLAAQVMQSEAARSDRALVRSVNHVCHREGLASLCEVGEETHFDPASHDPLGKAIEPGAATIVVRGGYTWTDGERDVVLLKPHVVVLQE